LILVWTAGRFPAYPFSRSNCRYKKYCSRYGNISTIIDTLGRTLTFNYDASGYPFSITQTWHREVESGNTTQTVTETHNWARFTYADKTIRTNFTGLTVFGPANNQTIHALTKVQLADDSVNLTAKSSIARSFGSTGT